MKLNLKRIDMELKKREWSRYRLALEIGIKPNGIYTVLSKGSFKTVRRLSQVFEIPEKELVEEG